MVVCVLFNSNELRTLFKRRGYTRAGKQTARGVFVLCFVSGLFRLPVRNVALYGRGTAGYMFYRV